MNTEGKVSKFKKTVSSTAASTIIRSRRCGQKGVITCLIRVEI